MPARAAVEALLRERKLDRTLTSTLPDRLHEDAVAAFGIEAFDTPISGPEGRKGYAGLPRGHVSEVIGPASSGTARSRFVVMMLLRSQESRSASSKER